MESLVAEEKGGRAFRVGRTLTLPEHGGHIVVGRMDGVFCQVGVGGQQLVLDDGGGEFKVANADGPGRVARWDQLGTDGRGEAPTPEEGMDPFGCVDEGHAPHTGAGRVGGAKNGRCAGNGFRDLGRALGQWCRQALKVGYELMDGGGKPDTVRAPAGVVFEGVL